MPDKYDPYRERLVMETQTEWESDKSQLDEAARQRIALELHEHPDAASRIDYLRMHTGFCRKITVTDADLQRLGERH